MKRILFLVYLLSSLLYCHAELEITLNIETPGSLSSMIASSKKSQITSLTLTGKLNGSDISYIREMAGAGYKGTLSSSKCALEYLDISNASIVSGGSYYAFEHTNATIEYTDKKYYTEDNSITPFMFDDCYKLKTLLLPNTVTKIDTNAFWNSYLVSITLPSCLETFSCIIPSFYLSEIKISESNKHFKVIDGTLYSIDMKTLYRCPVNYSNSIFNIPEGVENIYASAFYNCENIKYFEYPTTLKSFGHQSLAWMNLEKFILFPSVEYSKLGYYSSINEVEIKDGFSSFDASILGRGGSETEISVSTVIIHSEVPPTIPDVWHSFGEKVLKGSLYIPKGTYSAYYIAYGWGDFSNIYEMDGGGSNNKCAKPSISYLNGKLSFFCETDGVSFISTITNSDISSYKSNEIQLGVTYNINVYATKTGYDNSDVATATLCWIDVDPKTEGISNSVTQVQAHAVLIQASDGQITITGADNGTEIYAYEINGQQVGATISHNGYANLNTNMRPGSIAIIKIGDRSVKVAIK